MKTGLEQASEKHPCRHKSRELVWNWPHRAGDGNMGRDTWDIKRRMTVKMWCG